MFDVAVDIRQGSTTFLHWHAKILSADNHRTLVIPEGFAYGLQTRTEGTEMIYFHTAAYQPSAVGDLNARHPRLNIRWPEPVSELPLRDAAQPLVTEGFGGLAV